MTQKKSKQKNTNLSDEKNRMIETIRKSQIAASNEFEIKKLMRPQEGLLPCSIEEGRETLTVCYEIQNLLPFSNIRHEKRELLISALIDAGKLQNLAEMYRFTLVPDNLYYDIQGRVFVKARDVYGPDDGFSQENFLREYKSLIGCTLVKKYKFDDYSEGGLDLLKEDRVLKEILECRNTGQILELLHAEYFRYRKEHQERFVEIPKAKNRRFKVFTALFGVIAIISAATTGYFLLWQQPYEEAVIAANEAYLQSDYSGTVEAMELVAVERMNIYQKYILAVSCVKCENFGEDSSKNILNTIVINGDEKIMEYWIYINRLDTEAAADIAMQESSDQLLYYAYLKERAIIENDSSLSGQEKNELLSNIENRLKPLEEEFLRLTEE